LVRDFGLSTCGPVDNVGVALFVTLAQQLLDRHPFQQISFCGQGC
jgi:hypothetical protein